MNTMSIFKRNMIVGLGIALLLLFADDVGPRSYFEQIKLSCSQSSKIVENMNHCSKERGNLLDCSCVRMENPFYTAYIYLFIPLLAGLLGSVFLRGALIRRLIFLNGAIITAMVALFIRALTKDGNALMGIPFLPFVALGICIVVTTWFFLFRTIAWLSSRSLRRAD